MCLKNNLVKNTVFRNSRTADLKFVENFQLSTSKLIVICIPKNSGLSDKLSSKKCRKTTFFNAGKKTPDH
jgi:hypothetical protein